MFNSKKAQTSIEFVFILAIAIGLLVPATLVFNRYTQDSQNGLINSQVNKIGSELVHACEKMHASGVAWETVQVKLPGAIKQIKVYNGTKSELVIVYQTDYLSQAVFFTDVTILNETGRDCSNGCLLNVFPGISELRIESNSDGDVIINPRN